MTVVAECADGDQVVPEALRTSPDVVLLDLRMPEMSGLEATELLREVAPELPVVLLSAYDDPGLQERAAAAGVHTYLVKGCSAQSLHAAVEAAASGG
jgi:two-component system response regulator DesR